MYPENNPWVLSALYSGIVMIWDYSTNTCVKSFEMCDVPVRCARFISRKQWFVAGTDDMQLRVYNYNTMDKIKEWEASRPKWNESEHGINEYMKMVQSLMGGNTNTERRENKKKIKQDLKKTISPLSYTLK